METDLPIACTLTGSSYEERLKWIAELNQDGLIGHRRSDLVLNLRYAKTVAERVSTMVEQERECCGFLQFAIVPSGEDEIRLTITAPERAREVAELLFEPFMSTTVLRATPHGTVDPCCGGSR